MWRIFLLIASVLAAGVLANETTTAAVTIMEGEAESPALEEPFPLPEGLRAAVKFWTRIYTDVDIRGGLIHDNESLDIVYEHLDLSFDLEPDERIEWRLKRYRSMLWNLAEGDRSGLNCEERRLLALLGGNPSKGALRAAAKRVRFQRGQSDRFVAGLIRSGAWRAFIDQTLAAYGLPQELAVLPYIESSYHPLVFSHAGAAGLWQFMPITGRRFMQIDPVLDERLDPFESTLAAAQLLQFNHRILGSWPLALTAYNHGVSGVRRAVESTGSRDIGVIVNNYRGPLFGFASRNYYAAFLAVLEVAKHPERHFYQRIEPRPAVERSRFELAAYLPADILAERLGIDKAALKRVNPALGDQVWRGSKHIPKGYRLNLPEGYDPDSMAERLQRAALEAGIDQQRPDIHYEVSPGDTIATIALKYRVGLDELRAMNGIEDDKGIRIGRTLRLPPPGRTKSPPGSEEGVRRYQVRSDDTLSQIAERFGLRTFELMKANDLLHEEDAMPGQMLMIPRAKAKPGEQVYLVCQGDTLSQIAERYGLRTPELMAANDLDDRDSIREGQVLRVPKPKARPGERIYRVRPGDTLSQIARRFGLKPPELLEYTGLSGQEPLKPGKILRVPFSPAREPDS
ncbi:MAG: LysM peptidoglycan-binding domain-containing protein [Gammaproteobacteria bacterium]|nr:LysM peptidoglycan-binding domain-containing protein [Gammaproteobacteria bacterium]MBU1653847.1 LysM peptidoglycan-binding domain-containing protein [Gammaproteobacteria bacterium]MBU1961034.1 LysM peptidoglycan-binding domain-containing protein [Gammaproteobacteria bacterium]